MHIGQLDDDASLWLIDRTHANIGMVTVAMAFMTCWHGYADTYNYDFVLRWMKEVYVDPIRDPARVQSSHQGNGISFRNCDSDGCGRQNAARMACGPYV